mgnify:CR=1 FL=1
MGVLNSILTRYWWVRSSIHWTTLPLGTLTLTLTWTIPSTFKYILVGVWFMLFNVNCMSISCQFVCHLTEVWLVNLHQQSLLTSSVCSVVVTFTMRGWVHGPHLVLISWLNTTFTWSSRVYGLHLVLVLVGQCDTTVYKREIRTMLRQWCSELCSTWAVGAFPGTLWLQLIACTQRWSDGSQTLE